MPDFRIRASGEIISDLRNAFPNVSIPVVPSAEDLDALGVDPVLEGAQPNLTQFQSVLRSGPEQDSLGNWVWVYTAVDWDAEAIAAATEAQWANVRSERNRKLAECDWTQLPDAPVDSVAWATYRQALRDITTQSDPFAIVWPEEPN